MKKALITGITGQDGAYLAEFLLKKKIKVYGLLRRTSSQKFKRLEKLKLVNKIEFIWSDITEHIFVNEMIKKLKPDYIFNLAAQSFVQYSFDNPEYTFKVNFDAVRNICDTIVREKLNTRFYQASSSEMFGNSKKIYQNEKTEFNPCSPYALSKLKAHNLVKNYRENYNKFLCSGILFNHESPFRGIEFVTKKITTGLKKLSEGGKDPISLGNIYSKRDWGDARDYIESIYQIVTHREPDDFVVSTGNTLSVKSFFVKTSKKLKFDPIFKGKGINEKCYDKSTGKLLMKINKKYFRPHDLTYLRGDSFKIRNKLSWKPKRNINNLIEDMLLDTEIY